MAKNKIYTFDQYFKEAIKDKKFREAWKKEEPKYLLAKAIIQKRLAKKMSQRELAKKAKTSQAVISNIETMNANPSLNQINKIARALGSKLVVSFK